MLTKQQLETKRQEAEEKIASNIEELERLRSQRVPWHSCDYGRARALDENDWRGYQRAIDEILALL